jgi:hypothetical protein
MRQPKRHGGGGDGDVDDGANGGVWPVEPEGALPMGTAPAAVENGPSRVVGRLTGPGVNNAGGDTGAIVGTIVGNGDSRGTALLLGAVVEGRETRIAGATLGVGWMGALVPGATDGGAVGWKRGDESGATRGTDGSAPLLDGAGTEDKRGACCGGFKVGAAVRAGCVLGARDGATGRVVASPTQESGLSLECLQSDSIIHGTNVLTRV